MLDYIQHDTGDDPTFSVIWLHGLGADGHDFEPIVSELMLPPKINIRFIFPHAPLQPVTINGGMTMRAWYDILSMEIAREIDNAGIERSAEHVRKLVDREIERGIASDNIILAGFSQGGAIALHTGLTYEKPLLGILALSTYVPMPDSVTGDAGRANSAVSIFMGHGIHDPVVPVQLGRQSYDYLISRGYDVEWHTYPMQHSVNMDEIRDVSTWMTTLLENQRD